MAPKTRAEAAQEALDRHVRRTHHPPTDAPPKHPPTRTEQADAAGARRRAKHAANAPAPAPSPAPERPATRNMTAPWGSPAFSLAEHVRHLTPAQHAAYQRGEIDALPRGCLDGHPRGPVQQATLTPPHVPQVK